MSDDITSCAKLKCIIRYLNFCFDDKFIDNECWMIDMKQTVNTI